MRFLNYVSISKKMPVIMVLLVVISASVSGLLSITKQRDSLVETAGNQLVAVAEARYELLAQEVVRAGKDLADYASRPTTSKLILGLSNGWHVLGDDAGPMLREAFVTSNPHPEGERYKLDEPAVPGLWAFGGSHKAVHPVARALIQNFDYQDLFLIDAAGNVVYSVNKGQAFATNVFDGPYADSGLGRIARALAEA